MTIANVSPRSARNFPLVLSTAQEAIQLPEVQEVLCKLSNIPTRRLLVAHA